MAGRPTVHIGFVMLFHYGKTFTWPERWSRAEKFFEKFRVLYHHLQSFRNRNIISFNFFGKKPWITENSSSEHHTITSSLFYFFLCIFQINNVTISENK